MKLDQKTMDLINTLITKTIAEKLGISESDVPCWVSIGWKVCDDGLSRYFVAGNIDDSALKELGPILLDMCDQLAGMGHLPKIKLHRDNLNPHKLIEGQHEYDKKKCGDCGGDCDALPRPWSELDKKKWN